VIIAQFCKRNGMPGLTKLLSPGENIAVALEYTEEELASFFEVTTDRERDLFSTFLLTGFREQEVAVLFWSDVNLKLKTIRVTSRPHLGFSPKRWEEREIPIPVDLARLRRSTYATRMLGSGFDVPTVQHWVGYKSLETTTRYLVPASDAHERLDRVVVHSVVARDAIRERSVFNRRSLAAVEPFTAEVTAVGAAPRADGLGRHPKECSWTYF